MHKVICCNVMITKDVEPPKSSSIGDQSNNYEVHTIEYHAAVQKNEAAQRESIWDIFPDTSLSKAARCTGGYGGNY